MPNTYLTGRTHALAPSALILIIFTSLSLTGCGGGGSGGGDSASVTGTGTGSYTPQPSSTSTNTAQLNWQTPTKNVDGSCAANVSTYRISYGTTSHQYTNNVTVDLNYSDVICQQVDYDAKCGTMVLSCTHTISGLGTGTWYFAMQAIDAQHNQSSYSNEVSKKM